MSVTEQKLIRLTAAGRFDLCKPGECIRVLSTGPETRQDVPPAAFAPDVAQTPAVRTSGAHAPALAASRIPAVAPGITYNPRSGGCGRMLKVLLNGTCSYDCAYCPVRLEREQISFSPGELADTFLGLWREGRVGGLFLSSGIPRDVDCVMHDLVETGELLRRQGYDGYLHLKVLPGATRADIHDAA
ncbi:MAG: radical SAM protein, partial [Methanoculleus sp.]|nr:radical SAM protein [Methanoculleus sp.]